MTRPAIGITARLRAAAGAIRIDLDQAYARAVSDAGGLPLVLPPIGDPDRIDDLVATLDGLVLSGGSDVDPARYGAAPHPRLSEVAPERDAFELPLASVACRRRLPTLAICRGCQVVNVALGGTLWQDLPSERPGSVAHDIDGPRTVRSHPVALAPDSTVARAVAATRLDVNSLHHQAVRDLAPDLRVTGTAPDGTIEAFEGTDGWLVGVQWHPEAFWAEDGAPDLGLFRALVRAASGRVRPRGRAPAHSGR